MKKCKCFLILFLFGLIILLNGANVFADCYGVGYGHLDVSWRWSINEGINKMRNTVMKQLYNMNKFPDFKYSMDNIAEYEWIETYYPELFSQIQKRVAEGRWEIYSGMWTEPLADLLSGEEFARQWLIGKRYVKEKFNVDVKISGNVDNYSSWPGGNIPQIAKKSGIENYIFVRGLQNTNGKFFWWIANDGSKLFSHDSNFWYNCQGGCDCSSTEPALKYYGLSDGGGGPNEEQAGNCAGAKCATLNEFFKEAEDKYVPETTKLTATGYTLSTGGDQATGLLTHRPFIKWYNRKSFNKLLEAEKFSMFASSLKFNYPREHDENYLNGSLSGESGDFNYPRKDINTALKKFLYWQHHDNMPGNFTWEGVNIAHNDYQIVYKTYENVLDSALQVIGSHIHTDGQGTPVVVYNSLSWKRTGAVEVNLDRFGNPQNVDVTDSDGNVIPSQISSDGKKKVVFLAENIPATGYKVFRIVPAEKPASMPKTTLVSDEKNLSFENEYFKLQIDKDTGFWKSVYDKVNKREALSGTGNVLGYANADGWPYGGGFKEWGTDYGKADSIDVVESGPVRVKIRVKHGIVMQDTMLYLHVNRIDCYTWSDNYLSGGGPAYLRVVFPLNVSDGVYTTEAPYGYSESPDKNTDIEKPTLSWQDLSDGKFGASLINDSKYGGDRKENKIKLSLISHAEFDEQKMLYSLYPHKGDWRTGNTPQLSYDVNFPLIAKVENNHNGDLPESLSFVQAEPQNVIVSVVKKHEDSKDAIVRLYETSGKKTKVSLTFPGGVLSAKESDIMEWHESPQNLSVTDDKVVYADMSPYEIKTLKVKLPRFFGNKMLVEYPKQFIFVQGAPSGFSITLNNSTSEPLSVNAKIKFPADSHIAPKTLDAKLQSAEIKENEINIEAPQNLFTGNATLELSYGKVKETKIIPFEVIPSVANLKDNGVRLYKVWEAEELSHKTGEKVSDKDAVNGTAWLTDAGKDKENEHVVFGPYETFPEGKYLVSFRIKIKEKIKDDVATLDVFATIPEMAGFQEVKAKALLKGNDFTKENFYQEFVLPFRQSKPIVQGLKSRIEFRVFWHGKTTLTIDRIAVFKVLKK